MSEKKIKVVVSTGWANGDHVDSYDLPNNWEALTESQRRVLINEYASLFACSNIS